MGTLNVENRTIFCRDNLDILENINSDCIDLIYLDPPFNKKKTFTAPIGSSAEGAEFSDIFKEEDIKDEWVKKIEYENSEFNQLHEYLKSVKHFSNKYNYCYLVYMAVRLIECHRILKDTGSVYFHCDQTMSHYLKIMMDGIYGEKNFITELTWNYGTPSGGRAGGKKPVKTNDNILHYAKCYGKHTYNIQYTPYKKEYIDSWFRHTDENERRYRTRKRQGKIVRQYLDESPGVPLSNVWSDIMQLYSKSGWFPNTKLKETTGYPTQKPVKLLERIIMASSNKGDVVLDPFCGCATTCVAAERLDRKWVGIDVSHKAYELVKKRMQNELERLYMDSDYCYRTTPPKKSVGEKQEQGYVYVISNDNWKADNFYKVGIAKDVNRRLNSYQTSDPYRAYRVEYKKKTPYYKEIEKHIHNKFPAANEWVKAGLEDIKKEISDYKKD